MKDFNTDFDDDHIYAIRRDSYRLFRHLRTAPDDVAAVLFLALRDAAEQDAAVDEAMNQLAAHCNSEEQQEDAWYKDHWEERESKRTVPSPVEYWAHSDAA